MSKACFRLSRQHLAAGAISIFAIVGHAAGAQDTAVHEPTPPVSPEAATTKPVEPTGTGDIIVTARKRAETAQHIPLSIGVVTAAALARTGSSSLLQLAAVSPGINVTRAPTGNEIGITIRGLGSTPGVPSFDSSVSLFIDGVYAPRNREFAGSMFDIERIEVVRGTQAALLGKNTSLGAINLITKKPGDKFEADLRSSYEFNLHSKLLTGGADLPITDRLKIRLSGQSNDDGGWVRNILTDRKSIRTFDDALRGVLVWKPTDTLDITAVAQHDVNRNYGSPVEFLSSDGTPELLQALAGYPGTIDFQLDRRNAVGTPDQSERLRIDRYSVAANLALGDATLTSISGYSAYRDDNLSDTDFQAGTYSYRTVAERGKQVSQEVRLVSPADRPINYVVGALYLHNTLDNVTTIAANYPIGPFPGVDLRGTTQTNFAQTTDTISGFGQVTARVSDKLRLLGGIRYTHEKKDVDLSRVALVPGLISLLVYQPYSPFTLGHKEGNVDYSGGFQYDVTRNFLAYASYGKGTKGAGFAQSATLLDQSAYDKEVARTIEAGVKIQDPGRRWLFNLSGFYTRVDGFQLVTFNGIQFIVGNTDLSSRGFELESSWTPVKGLRLFLNNTYADAKDRRTGAPIPLAPKWTGSGGFGYQTEMSGSLNFLLDGSIDYRSKRYYQQDPTTSPVGKAFTTYNLSAAIASASQNWEMRLIGRNLTNANALAFAFPTPFLNPGNQNGISERPRTVALQLSLKY